MKDKQTIAVAGATGTIGHHVVDVLEARGHDVVPISRSHGVDLISGTGLDEHVAGVDTIIDAAGGPSPDERDATEFFRTSARNIHAAARRAGISQIVAVSIIGIDQFTAGYYKAKTQHEKALLDGPIPVKILRSAQFHELVRRMVDWGRQGDVAFVPRMRMQPVAARTAAEALADLAISPDEPAETATEIAGPREHNLVDLARLLVIKRGDSVRIEDVRDESDPDRDRYESGALLPGPNAIIGGPTFEEWLDGGQ